MRCQICGEALRSTQTDLPFKVSLQTIVLLKNLPVLHCDRCAEYVIEDSVLARVEEILASVDSAAELEIIRFAA